MTPEQLLGFVDQLGVTIVAVVLLTLFVIPALWKMRGGGTKEAVDDALLRRDVSDIRKIVDDHEERLEALEKPKPRSRS